MYDHAQDYVQWVARTAETEDTSEMMKHFATWALHMDLFKASQQETPAEDVMTGMTTVLEEAEIETVSSMQEEDEDFGLL